MSDEQPICHYHNGPFQEECPLGGKCERLEDWGKPKMNPIEPNDKQVEQRCDQEALWHVMNLPTGVEQPKAGELPPLDEYSDEVGDKVERGVIMAIRIWGCPTALDWKLRATHELQVTHRALDQANKQVSCRERQLLAEQQVSAGLKMRAERLQKLLDAYNSSGFADADAAMEKYLDAINDKSRAEASLAEANAELATLKAQEAPQKAWERGWKWGYADGRHPIGSYRPNPYIPPKESE